MTSRPTVEPAGVSEPARYRRETDGSFGEHPEGNYTDFSELEDCRRQLDEARQHLAALQAQNWEYACMLERDGKQLAELRTDRDFWHGQAVKLPEQLAVAEDACETAQQQLAELRLRQCACSWSDDDERVMDMCNAHKEACEQQLAELRKECACGHPYACGAAEQPSLGKCAAFATANKIAAENVGSWGPAVASLDCEQPSLPAGSLAIAIEDAQRKVAGWPNDVRAAMGVQPERQVVEHAPIEPGSGWCVCGQYARKSCGPSTPQDDIVAGLRALRDAMAGSAWDEAWPNAKPALDRAIAALGEKGWIPVSEQAPPYKPCLMWWIPITPNKYAECVVVGQRSEYNYKDQVAPFGEVWYWANGRTYSSHFITHWMPLPSPPVSGGK